MSLPKEGACAQCGLSRPLFEHKQEVKWDEFHGDCSHCRGHDYEEVRKADLCSYCWQNTPVKLDERTGL